MMRPSAPTRFVSLALLALACSEPVRVSGVVRDGRTGRLLEGVVVRAGDTRAETDGEGHFELRVDEGEVVLRAEDPAHCPATETIVAGEEGAPPVTLHVFERLEVEALHAQVGFDKEVRIPVRLRCDEGEALRWTQTSGPELGARLKTERGGRVLVVRTHPLEELAPLEPRLGPVSLDRHERGDYRVRLRLPAAGGSLEREVRVIAAPTSSGTYQVPTGADVYLQGGTHPALENGTRHEWEVLNQPDESEVRLETFGADPRLARFRPDAFGMYLFAHEPSGTLMLFQAGAYDQVPRDCGRSSCHQPQDEGWQSTAHARTFLRGMEGELGPEFSERCWSCHVTGAEPGVANGGFHEVAREAQWSPGAPHAGASASMPPRVRAHASVWCSSCHGPGRILPPQFHAQYGAKFRVDVCARCHDVDEGDPDANHISPHVVEWRRAAMSRFTRVSDAPLSPRGFLPETAPARREACARCHSAQGFVAWRRTGETEIRTDRGTVQPLTCPTCHNAHEPEHPRGLRLYDTTDALAGAPVEGIGAGALCATCHRAAIEDVPAAAPHAPQANVLLGRGARLAVGETPLHAHGQLATGCVACHMARPAEGDPLRGFVGGHTFAVRSDAEHGGRLHGCGSCHGDADPEALGARDLDGDGQPGALAAELERALRAFENHLAERISAAALRGRCGREARGVSDYDGRMMLADESGHLLGDCDGDGLLGEGERGLGAERLPRSLRDAAHDLLMLRRDGSGGRHNPGFTEALVTALRRALR